MSHVCRQSAARPGLLLGFFGHPTWTTQTKMDGWKSGSTYPRAAGDLFDLPPDGTRPGMTNAPRRVTTSGY
ncbi:hypothetical protein BV25DRAFT_1824029 [Artomyces pyxidatus]|uniref:Uncharacterized protein n=1 Tax=Artomyces pyxidatus TaxID=48021 RepID=A0ACB8T406_9AGAM|nr:hypothetical protein BV25DRAFT_1824029 [Artomyces pyxidatus]